MFCLGYIQIYLELRKYCNFGAKSFRRAWHVIPAQSTSLYVRVSSTGTYIYLPKEQIVLLACLVHYSVSVISIQTELRLELCIAFNKAQQLLIKFTRTKRRYI